MKDADWRDADVESVESLDLRSSAAGSDSLVGIHGDAAYAAADSQVYTLLHSKPTACRIDSVYVYNTLACTGVIMTSQRNRRLKAISTSLVSRCP